MPRGKFSWKREDGAVITHCGGTEVKNTHSGDYFFTKGEFCGVCKKSKKANRQNLLICPGCKLAKYCSKACQQRDLESHKKDCDNVAHYLEMLPKIEAKFVKWNWNEHQDVQAKFGDWRDVVFDVPEGRKDRGLLTPPKRDRPENLFKTILGQFCSYSKVNCVQNLGGPRLAAKVKEDEDVWPREYVRRRMRYAEAMWEIAYKHESYEATEKVLNELLEIKRLDFLDPFNAKHMAAFMFLYLNRYDDAFSFLHFWMRIKTENEKRFNLKRGEWLFDKGYKTGGIGENFLQCAECFGPSLEIPHDGSLLAMTALKMKLVKDLEAKLEATNGYGIKREIEAQNKMIKMCFKMLYMWNPTLLRALLIPQPMLQRPLPQQCKGRGPSNASIIVRYAWVFFDKLPGASEVISNFLNPKYPGMPGYPGYDIGEEENQFTGSRYDRFYENSAEDLKKGGFYDKSDLVSSDEENDEEEDSDEEPVHIDFDELNITDMKSAKKAMKIGKKTYY